MLTIFGNVVILLLPLVLLLVIASVYDFLYLRVPNWLIFLGLLWGFAISIFSWGSLTVFQSFWGMFIGGLLFIYPYMRSYIGAGDVKLMGLVGVFLGPQLTVYAALFSMVAGAIFTLVYALNKKLLKQSLTNLLRLHIGDLRLPYAAAILSGTLCAILWRGID